MTIESPKDMESVTRKKTDRKTVMVRTYDDFADRVRRASGERDISAADFCDQFLLSCVEKAHRDYIKSEAKKIANHDLETSQTESPR